MIKKDSIILLCIFVLSIQLTVYPGKVICSGPGVTKDPLSTINESTTKLEDKNLNKMDNDQKAKTDTYEKMVARSLISTGNNYRMKKALEKANKGQELIMVYLGGSITEGYNGGPNGCYAKLSYDYFSQTFGTGNNVKYIN